MMNVPCYKEWNPREETMQLIDVCKRILVTDLAGYRVTLRQLYYQLVSRNIIDNKESAYKRLGSILSRARLAGLLSWDQIEDRGRAPQKHPQFDNLVDLVDAAVRSYRLPRWKDQDTYVELWVEKDALASVLRPIADEYHITLMVNRGYSSQSAMKESAERFRRNGRNKDNVLLYLGDLDPSGEDMVRDIRDRMRMFWVSVDVRKIALTVDQVNEHQPPPNPAKLTDPRARAFIAEFGGSSWEVDALHPNVLRQTITNALDPLVDSELMDVIKEREQQDIEQLKDAVESL